MKMTALILAIVLLVSMPLSVFAAPRTIDADPKLSFNGTTANCEATVVGSNTSDYIEVTMKLKWGIFTVEKWTASGYAILTHPCAFPRNSLRSTQMLTTTDLTQSM